MSVLTFYTRNRQGFYLARHDGSGTNKLRVKWVRTMAEADGKPNWIEADDLRMMLPSAETRRNAWIVNQNSREFSAEKAQRENVFHSRPPEERPPA